ncbi:MAG: archaeosortase/exosortase family protein [Bacteroidota bacterium]|nr:archaeosortase/exosortase family protein [Bacteroidota bacterium]
MLEKKNLILLGIIIPKMNLKKLKLSKQNILFLKKIVINLAILVPLWFLFYHFFKQILIIDYFYEQGIYYLTKVQLVSSKIVLEIFGFDVNIFGKTIKIINSRGVHLDRGCLGRNTLGLLAGFILVFPGKTKNKIWYIGLGIIIFIMLNITRIVSLTIINSCCPQHLDINHHYIFKIIIFFVIFLLWARWIKKYSTLSEKK